MSVPIDAKALRFVIAGAGGMGREALAWARDAYPTAEAVAFWTAPGGPEPSGADTSLPVLTDLAQVAGVGATHVVLGIGDNPRRRAVTVESELLGLEPLTVVHPTAFVGPCVSVGVGAIVAPGAVLTRDIIVGSGAVVNYRAAVGHGSRVGDWSFIGPAAALAGGVDIGDDASIGIGAIVLPGRRVGRGATVGGGAVVVADVEESATVVGNPARPL